jgi:hypothetical protein
LAYTPEQKAAVLADLIAGMSVRDAAEKHGLPSSTIGAWRAGIVRNGTEIQTENRFNSALNNFLHATVTMLEAWATECSKPDFIQKNPEGVNELGRTVLERADRFVELLRPTADENNPG